MLDRDLAVAVGSTSPTNSAVSAVKVTNTRLTIVVTPGVSLPRPCGL